MAISAPTIGTGQPAVRGVDVQRKAGAGDRSLIWQVWPALLLVYSLLAPPEIALKTGGLELFLYRLVLFAMIPLVLFRMYRRVMVFGMADLAILGGCVWIFIAITMNNGIAVATKSGGSLFLDLALSYLIARVSITSTRNLEYLLVRLAPGLAVVGAILAFESLSGRLWLRPAMVSIFGPVSGSAGLREMDRLGLMRAYGPFGHPILAGLQMAFFVPLYFYAVRDARSRMLGVLSSFTAIFALSSAALMSLGMSYGGIVFHWLQQRVKDLNWYQPLYAFVAVVIFAQVFVNGGAIAVVTRYLTLNTSSAWYRQWIWEYGTQSVAQHPLFGVGTSDWDRPEFMWNDTVDAHWLWLAIYFGLPTALLLFGAAISVVVGMVKQVNRLAQSVERRMRLALAMSMIILIFMMFTVSLYTTSQAMFMFFLGCSASLAAMKVGDASGSSG